MFKVENVPFSASAAGSIILDSYPQAPIVVKEWSIDISLSAQGANTFQTVKEKTLVNKIPFRRKFLFGPAEIKISFSANLALNFIDYLKAKLGNPITFSLGYQVGAPNAASYVSILDGTGVISSVSFKASAESDSTIEASGSIDVVSAT